MRFFLLFVILSYKTILNQYLIRWVSSCQNIISRYFDDCHLDDYIWHHCFIDPFRVIKWSIILYQIFRVVNLYYDYCLIIQMTAFLWFIWMNESHLFWYAENCSYHYFRVQDMEVVFMFDDVEEFVKSLRFVLDWDSMFSNRYFLWIWFSRKWHVLRSVILFFW